MGGWEGEKGEGGKEGCRTWGQPYDQEWTCVHACFTHCLLGLHAGSHSDAHIGSEDARTKTGASNPSRIHGKKTMGWLTGKNVLIRGNRLPHYILFIFSTSTESLHSPEPRKGYVSSLSLSPSGPAATVPRSKRDVPLPESGKRGNRDWMAWATKTRKSTKMLTFFVHPAGATQCCSD